MLPATALVTPPFLSTFQYSLRPALLKDAATAGGAEGPAQRRSPGTGPSCPAPRFVGCKETRTRNSPTLVPLPALPRPAETQKDASPKTTILPIKGFSQTCPVQCTQSTEVPWGTRSSSSYRGPFHHTPHLSSEQLPLPPPWLLPPTFAHLTRLHRRVSALSQLGECCTLIQSTAAK